MPLRPARAARRGVIGRPVARTAEEAAAKRDWRKRTREVEAKRESKPPERSPGKGKRGGKGSGA